MKYSCPCCGYYTFPVPADQAVAYICPVCCWENDVFIESDEENFKKHAVCDLRLKQYVRPPTEEEKHP